MTLDLEKQKKLLVEARRLIDQLSAEKSNSSHTDFDQLQSEFQQMQQELEQLRQAEFLKQDEREKIFEQRNLAEERLDRVLNDYEVLKLRCTELEHEKESLNQELCLSREDISHMEQLDAVS